ncbi:MAG: transglycosylase SLT domain-containing protein [Planctomycetes bacterium]|nr:transglycosylase SLT domain-containing protein [Planctomycetota bacterium]
MTLRSNSIGLIFCALLALVAIKLLGGDFERVAALLPNIKIAAAESAVDPYLLAGLVFAESRGQADALSSVDASGYCQLLPSTAAEVAGKMKISGPPYSPQDNLRMGAFYLAQMTRRWDGDKVLGLLSYRLGAGRVSRNIKEHGSSAIYIDSMRGKAKTPLSYVEQILDYQQRFADYDQDH